MKALELETKVKQDAMEEIKRYFWEERGEEISNFQAEKCLDFFLDTVGPFIYNQAIHDAYILINKKIEDLYDLEKRPR